MSQFIKQFKDARRVSTPLVCVRTPDAASTIRTILSSLNGESDKTPVLCWDVVHGFTAINKPAEREIGRITSGEVIASVNPVAALQFAEKLVTDSVLFFQNAHKFWNDAPVLQAVWNLRDVLKKDGQMLVMLTTQGALLPAELSDDVLVIDEILPTPEDLAVIIADCYENAGIDPPEETAIQRATDAVIGLAAFPAEQALAMSLTKKSGMDYAGLWERKRQAIEQTPGLSVWRGGESFDAIGGIKALKKFFRDLIAGKESPRLFVFIDEIEKHIAGAGTDTSGVKTELVGTMLTWMQDTETDGLILVGPPGTSKSNISKAAGNEAGIPTIAFDFSGMQSQFVGESGNRLRAALKIIAAMSRGRVTVIATCNAIDKIPPALKRRFTLGTFFIDLPTSAERSAIWKIYEKKYNVAGERPSDDGWTGAEIKECCRKAWRLNVPLLEAADYIVPVSVSDAEGVKGLRLQASGKFISASEPGIYTYQETATSQKPARKMRAETE